MVGNRESRGVLSAFVDPLPWLDEAEAEVLAGAGYYLALVLGDLAGMAGGGTVVIDYEDTLYTAGGILAPPAPPAQVGVVHSELSHSMVLIPPDSPAQVRVIHSEVLGSIGAVVDSYAYLEKDRAITSPTKITSGVSHAF